MYIFLYISLVGGAMEHCNWQLTSCGEELTKSCANLCQLSEALPAELNFFWGERGFSDGLQEIEKNR